MNESAAKFFRAHLKSDAWKKLTTAVAERQARLASESATPAG